MPAALYVNVDKNILIVNRGPQKYELSLNLEGAVCLPSSLYTLPPSNNIKSCSGQSSSFNILYTYSGSIVRHVWLGLQRAPVDQECIYTGDCQQKGSNEPSQLGKWDPLPPGKQKQRRLEIHRYQ